MLVNLKALEAEANCLTTLPAELAKCTKLEVLNVTGNELTSLDMLGGMVEMKSLLASRNKLEKLDFTVEVMVHLRARSSRFATKMRLVLFYPRWYSINWYSGIGIEGVVYYYMPDSNSMHGKCSLSYVGLPSMPSQH
jgi:Leucine-rich repeat (LRR) protein